MFKYGYIIFLEAIKLNGKFSGHVSEGGILYSVLSKYISHNAEHELRAPWMTDGSKENP